MATSVSEVTEPEDVWLNPFELTRDLGSTRRRRHCYALSVDFRSCFGHKLLGGPSYVSFPPTENDEPEEV
jgi:hypothetical protein